VVTDTPRAANEAGDLNYAVKSGAVGADRQTSLAHLASGAVSLPQNGLVVFKSVGTALQDLALATRYFEILRVRKDLPGALDLASLKKPVSAKPRADKR
jgi:ornithine cyclodeaminase/alanine dehydrogenase-like protein (mu-crystallin family)